MPELSNFDRLERTELKQIFGQMLSQTRGGSGSAGGGRAPIGQRPRPSDSLRGPPTAEGVAIRQRSRREQDNELVRAITFGRKAVGVRAATRTGILQAIGVSLRGATARAGAGVGLAGLIVKPITRKAEEFTGLGLALGMRALRRRGIVKNPMAGATTIARAKGTVRATGGLLLVAAAIQVVSELGRAAQFDRRREAFVNAKGLINSQNRVRDALLKRTGGSEDASTVDTLRVGFAAGVRRLASSVESLQEGVLSLIRGNSFNRSFNDAYQKWKGGLIVMDKEQAVAMNAPRERFQKMQTSGNFFGGWKGNDTSGP